VTAAKGQALYVKFFGEGVPGEKRLKAVGKKVRKGFLTSIDGFANLKAKLALQVDKHGWVPGLDGRRIPTRSEHSALNFMIQSCGAILCKRWMADASTLCADASHSVRTSSSCCGYTTNSNC
jgi:hypothetical protein